MQKINLKGWEPVAVGIPEVLAVLKLDALAALMYPLGIGMGFVALSWMLKNRPDLFPKRERTRVWS